MDLSPVYQAGPLLAGSFALLVVGLLCPAPVRGPVAKLGGLLTFAVLCCAAVYVGLGLATQAWETHPQYAWVGLVSAFGVAYLLAEQQRRKPVHKRDDDEDDDDGGQRLHQPEPPEPESPAPQPPPDLPPAPDWGEFDDLRKGWEREPAGV